jgi:hypothetical protein
MNDVLMYLEAGLAADLPTAHGIAIAHDRPGRSPPGPISTRRAVERADADPAGLPADRSRHRAATQIHPRPDQAPGPSAPRPRRPDWCVLGTPVFVPPDDAMVACVIVWRSIPVGGPGAGRAQSQLTSLALAAARREPARTPPATTT